MGICAYYIDDEYKLSKQGKLAYDSGTGKYTFSETENIINQGEVGSHEICVIFPDTLFSRALNGCFFTFLFANGNKLGLVISSSSARTIIDETYPAGHTYLNCYYLTLNTTIYTYVAGRQGVALAVVNASTGEIKKTNEFIYTVQNGIDNFEENSLEGTQYDDLLQAIANYQADIISQMEAGVITRSPNGTYWRITVSNAGVITAVEQ